MIWFGKRTFCSKNTTLIDIREKMIILEMLFFSMASDLGLKLLLFKRDYPRPKNRKVYLNPKVFEKFY